MKKIILLIVMMMTGVGLFAQRNARSMSERQVAKMKSELSLSEEQVLKLTELNKKFHDDQVRLRSDTTLTREKLANERKQMVESREKDLKRILTKEQYEKWMTAKPERPRPDERKRTNPMEEMKKELGLNDSQAREIRAINSEMGNKFQKLRSDSALTRESRAKALQVLTDERNLRVKKILTEDQYEKFLAYEKERIMNRRRGRGPARN